MTSWRTPEIGGESARVREVFAAGGADRERDAVGMELPHVQQGQRAVEAAGQDHADGEVGVDAHPDAVPQHGPDAVRRLVRIVDRSLTGADPQQVDERAKHWIGVGRRPNRDARAALRRSAYRPAPAL